MEKPDGALILKRLIDIYAKQEGIVVEYRMKRGDNSETQSNQLLYKSG